MNVKEQALQAGMAREKVDTVILEQGLRHVLDTRVRQREKGAFKEIEEFVCYATRVCSVVRCTYTYAKAMVID
jgi:hypothetical protein